MRENDTMIGIQLILVVALTVGLTLLMAYIWKVIPDITLVENPQCVF